MSQPQHIELNEQNPGYPMSTNDSNIEQEDYESGQLNKIEDDEFSGGLSQAPQKIRNQFIKKVYGIISVQLLITFTMVSFATKSRSFAQFLVDYSGLYVLAFILQIGSQLVLFCSRTQARKVPNNYIILLLFTLSMSYLTSLVCVQAAWKSNGKPDVEGQQIILIAGLLTAGITLALTIYAFQTSKDYTMYGGMLFVALVGVMIIGLLAFLTNLAFLHSLYLWIGVTLYGCYLVYDTQLLCEDKSRKLEIDDYIIGALLIYTDIIILFLRILKILLESRKNK